MPLDFPANPTDGQIFGNYRWDATVGVWLLVPQSTPQLGGLADVDLTAPADKDLLQYDGSEWVNRDVASVVGDVGKILQVVSTTRTDAFSFSVAGRGFSSPVLSVSITPKFASSKILVLTNVNAVNVGTNGYAGIQLRRDGVTTSFLADAAGDRQRLANLTNFSGQFGATAFQFLDSPNTTSSTSYEIVLWNFGGSTQTMALNRGVTDADAVNVPRFASSITVLEVAG